MGRKISIEDLDKGLWTYLLFIGVLAVITLVLLIITLFELKLAGI